MKLVKKITAAATALMMAVGIMSFGASASEYGLHYTTGAPSNTIKLSQTVSFTATNAGRITVNSTLFNTKISGAYAAVTSTTAGFPTNTSSVNSVGKYYLNYLSAGVPKSGTQLTAKAELVAYGVSQSVSAYGEITG